MPHGGALSKQRAVEAQKGEAGMKWTTGAFGVVVGLALAAGVAAAEGSGGASGGAPSSKVPAATSPDISGMEIVTPTPDPVAMEAKLNAIRERGRRMGPKQKESVEKQLAGAARQVETEAATMGEVVQGRLVAEFGVPAETLAAEREQYGVGWGEVMIAHTLMANAKGEVGLDQIYALRQEGLGWGQIAHGLNLNATRFVGAVKSEVSVARGTTKPDGKPALVASSSHASAKTGTKGKGNEATTQAVPKTGAAGATITK